MQVTNRRVYTFGKDKIDVEISDTKDLSMWRLRVNGKTSGWYSHYAGMLVFEGYAVAIEY